MLEELQRLLRYTMKDFAGKVYREPSREEFVLINHMALCLKRLGRMDEAEDLYRQVIERYEQSVVDARNHAISEFLLYINYVGLLEEENKLSEAEKVGWEGIHFMTECERGDVAATLLTNIACIYEKLPGKEAQKIARECMQNSYILLKLYQHPKDGERLKKYYWDKYGTNIEVS